MADADPPPRSSISFSLKNVQSKPKQAKSRVLIDGDADEPDTATSKDIPLSGKRKRDVPAPPPPKVIPLAAGSDWREERKRRLGLKDNEALRQGSPSMARAESNAPEQAFHEPQKQGLVTMAPSQRPNVDREDTPPHTTIAPGDVTPPTTHTNEQEPSAAVPPSDDDAIRALLSHEPIRRGAHANLVIEQPSEEDMFHHDVDSRPDEPTLHDYATMPVEEFGAAMLRGMGWKEGSGIGRDNKGPIHAPTVQRRAALLGLGAKERVVPSSSSRKPNDQRYMPVVSRSESPDRASYKGDRPRSEHRHDTYSSSDRSNDRSSRHYYDHARSSDRRSSSYASRYDDRHRSHSRHHDRYPRA